VCGIEFRTLNAPSRRQHFIYLFMARVSLLHFDECTTHPFPIVLKNKKIALDFRDKLKSDLIKMLPVKNSF
jgi:hypothetical protein